MTFAATPATAYLTLWTLGCAAGFYAGVVVLRARDALDVRTLLALGLAWEGLLIGSKWHMRLETMPLWEAILLSPADLLDPGRRLPLGVLTGGVLAGAWCLVSRAPWRTVGDALAIAASVLIPIGRLGCLSFGCCMGAVCGHSSSPFCWRFPPGTEAYDQQLRQGLIGLDARLSLPAHPLPVYFALASLATLGILICLWRRGAAEGTLLAAFCLLWPAAKLALEPLRATPRASALMVGIPLGVLVVTLAALGIRAVRRVALAGPQRAVALVLAAMVFAGGAARAEEPPMPETWSRALGAYAANPTEGRRALRALRREGIENLPPVILMAMADAQMRSGREHAAARLFDEVLTREPGEPWAGWASLGLGWVALGDGRLDAAREHFAAVAESMAQSRTVAALVLGLLDAGAGRTENAREVLGRVGDDPSAPPRLRQAASLGVGLALYWAGRYEEAAEQFDQAATTWSGGLFWDDARYAAAIARWRSGKRSEAKAALRQLAVGSVRRADTTMSPALLRLDRAALLRDGFRRHRRAPLRAPEEQVAALLDRDGGMLASAALERLVDAPSPVNATQSSERAPRPREVIPVTATASASAEPPAEPWPNRHPLRLALLLGAGLGAGVWAWVWTVRNKKRGSQRHVRRAG